MKTRLLTSLAIVASVALMFVLKVYISDYFFDVFFAFIAAFAGYEISKILSRMGLYNETLLLTTFPFLMSLATLLALFFGLNFGYVVLINFGVLIFTTFVTFIIGLIRKKAINKEMRLREIKNMTNAKFVFKKMLYSMIGMIYPTILFLTMILINHVDEITLENVTAFDGNLSLIMLIFAILIPMFTDSFAMLTGMLIGGKKLVPKISPKKTISGAIGGTLWCTLLCACVYLILGAIDYFSVAISAIEIWKLLIIIFVGSVIAQAGDIFESFLKRKAGVKDSGKILPGHGGMLDRIDSYIFVAPYLLIAVCFLLI